MADMRAVYVCVLLAAGASAAAAQEFEVVSVKPNKTGSHSSHSSGDEGHYNGTNVTLKSLIVQAFGVRDYQVEGPDWLDGERYDIAAKFAQALPKDREKHVAMMQAAMLKMLQQRYQLTVHRDQKMFAVYGLVAGKGGIKVKDVPDSGSHGQNTDNRHYTGECVSMPMFASWLAGRMDLPVVDATGIKGFYNITLDWIPDPKEGDNNPPAGMTLREAVEEVVGLKLDRRKAPIEVIVVDHVERVPTEN